MKTVILFSLLMLGFVVGFSQDSVPQDFYNLNFTVEKGKEFKWDRNTSFRRQLDTSEIKDGKMPLKLSTSRLTFDDAFRYKRRYKTAMNQKYFFEFHLFQTIFLPEMEESTELQISITSKSRYVKKAQLEIAGYNKDENIVFADTVSINHENGWNTQTISWSGSSPDFIKMTLWGNGGSPDREEQALWLDKIVITINGRDIYDYPLPCATCDDLHLTLNDKQIIPLPFPDSSDYNVIPAFSDPQKPIIAFGECLHGSEPICLVILQMMKSLVLNNHCKVIMLEKGADVGLKWDLYVRGLTPDSTLREIREEMRLHKTSLSGTIDFLRWLREHNKSQVKKVRLFGIDEVSNPRVFFFDYFTSLNANRRDAAWLLFLDTVSNQYIGTIVELIQADSTLVPGLEKKEFEYLISILKNEAYLMRLYADTVDVLAYHKDLKLRDYYMAERAKWIIGNHLDEGEKAVIFAHTGHINKLDLWVSEYADISNTSLGGYLYREFGERYYAVAIQAGEGIVQKQINLGGEQIEQQLSPPPYNSFEYSALKTGLNCFFYPADAVPAKMSHIRLISKEQIGSGFSFLSIPRRFDGLIFLRDNTPLDNDVKHGARELGQFNNERYKKRKDYIRKLREELQERNQPSK